MKFEIDPYAAFRNQPGTTAPKTRIVIDAVTIQGQVATAVAETIRANLAAGKAPDGQRLPSLAPATIERRARRKVQGDRGGQAASRYTDPRFRADAVAHFRERFPTRPPRGGATPGIESGTLINSIMVERGGVTALKRGNAFVRGLWGPHAQAQLVFRTRLQKILAGLVKR